MILKILKAAAKEKQSFSESTIGATVNSGNGKWKRKWKAEMETGKGHQ